MPIDANYVTTRPKHDRATLCGNFWLAKVNEYANSRGYTVTDLDGALATKANFESNIASQDPAFFHGVGHGSETRFAGHENEILLEKSINTSQMSGRITYLLSCKTAVELGPDIISKTGLAYLGYDALFGWYITAPPRGESYDPAYDRLHWAWMDFTDVIANSILKGETVDDAFNKGIARANAWIDWWNASADPIASEIVKWLIADRDALTKLGTTSSSITPPLAETSHPRSAYLLTTSGLYVDPGDDLNLIVGCSCQVEPDDFTGTSFEIYDHNNVLVYSGTFDTFANGINTKNVNLVGAAPSEKGIYKWRIEVSADATHPAVTGYFYVWVLEGIGDIVKIIVYNLTRGTETEVYPTPGTPEAGKGEWLSVKSWVQNVDTVTAYIWQTFTKAGKFYAGAYVECPPYDPWWMQPTFTMPDSDLSCKIDCGHGPFTTGNTPDETFSFSITLVEAYQPEGTFGKVTKGATSITSPTYQVKVACRYYLKEKGKINKVTAWVKTPLDPSGNAIGGIYSDNAGVPDKLLVTSSPVIIDSTGGWYDFTFESPITLEPGYYWLAVLCDKRFNYFVESGEANQLARNADEYADGFSDVFGTPDYFNYEMSIYGSYETIFVFGYKMHEEPYSYVIFYEGNVIKAKNGTTAIIDYESTDANQVFSKVLPNAGKIEVKEGTFEVGKLKVYSNTILNGMGPGKTIIKLKSGENSHLIINEDPTGNNQIQIRNLTLDANKEGQTVTEIDIVNFSNVKFSQLNNVNFRNSKRYGINLTNSEHNTVKESSIENIENFGIK